MKVQIAHRSKATETVAAAHGNLTRAIHHLEAALASPAPTREREWAGEVLAHLNKLTDSLMAHLNEVEAAGGLYAELDDAMPHAGNRIGYLRDTNRSLLDRVELLMREVRRVAIGEGLAFMAVRAHAADLMTELRAQQSREIDLVFEACSRDTGDID
jgi:hypothetical protein